MTKQCCKCQRVEHNGIWRPRRLTAERRDVTHGYCPECYRIALADIDAYIMGSVGGGRVTRRFAAPQRLHA